MSQIPDGFDYQGIIIRPPSEAHSILIQVTLGCSHNKCTFCGTYKQKRFAIKPEEVILKDLAFAQAYCQRQNKLFLMDGDVLVMPQKRLVWILEKVRQMLPWVRRVGVYGNRKSVSLKTDEQLAELKELGLGIVYYGMESGHDETLTRVKKGATSFTHALELRRLKEAGIKVSVSVLLGIAGREKSLAHARATGELISQVDPDYVGALTVTVLPGTELYEEQARGEFEMITPAETLVELREMLDATELSRGGMFFSNHASNYLPIKIRYPQGKKEALALLDRAIAGQVELRPEWLRGL